MLIISSFDVAHNFTHIPNSEGIVRSRGNLQMADDEDTAWMLTPAIEPTMATQYVGFDLRPEEQGIDVAVRRPGGSYQVFGEGWANSPEPVYYSAAQIRGFLPHWAGPIQFRIRLQRKESGESPRIRCLRTGYRVEGDFLSYLMEYVVRPWCKSPVRLIRNVTTPTGQSTMVPSRLNHQQMSTIQALRPGGVPRAVTIQTSPLRLRISPAIAPGMVQLQFGYAPEATFVTGIYQVQEVPVVLIRLLPGENRRRMNQSDWVRASEDEAAIWTTTFQYDQPLEFEVLADQFDDAMSIAQTLVSRINRDGELRVPAFGTSVFMRVRTGVQIGEPLQREGNLFSVKLRATIIGLLEGDHDTTVPLLTDYERDFVPQN